MVLFILKKKLTFVYEKKVKCCECVKRGMKVAIITTKIVFVFFVILLLFAIVYGKKEITFFFKCNQIKN